MRTELQGNVHPTQEEQAEAKTPADQESLPMMPTGTRFRHRTDGSGCDGIPGLIVRGMCTVLQGNVQPMQEKQAEAKTPADQESLRMMPTGTRLSQWL